MITASDVAKELGLHIDTVRRIPENARACLQDERRTQAILLYIFNL